NWEKFFRTIIGGFPFLSQAEDFKYRVVESIETSRGPPLCDCNFTTEHSTCHPTCGIDTGKIIRKFTWTSSYRVKVNFKFILDVPAKNSLPAFLIQICRAAAGTP